MWLIPANKSCVIKCTCRAGTLRPCDNQHMRGYFWREIEKFWRHFLYLQRSGSGFDSTTIRESFLLETLLLQNLATYFNCVSHKKLAALLIVPNGSQTKKIRFCIFVHYTYETIKVHKVHNKTCFFLYLCKLILRIFHQ